MPKRQLTTRPARFRDQHGRLWEAVVETQTGHPTGPIQFKHRTPKGSLPPWVPDAGHLDFDPMEQGQLTIAYDRVLDVMRENLKSWERLVRDVSLKIYADKAGDVMADMDKLPPALLEITGPKPTGLELVEACKAGNKWALGFTDAVPNWAKPLIAKPAPKLEAERQYPDADEESVESDGKGKRPRAA